MNHSQAKYLEAMDIDVFKLREAWNTSNMDTDVPLKNDETEDRTVDRPNLEHTNWEELEQKIKACTLCPLHKSRINTVMGVGNRQADLLIIGEAPGANEDKQGEPFVGRAGKLLDAMLQAIGLSRDKIYIANILKCRPPNNRDPLPSEVACCTPYLKQQIDWLKPKLIVAVGRIAAHFLLETDKSLGSLRGYEHEYNGIPLIITYHPAYLLRSPLQKAKSYEDLVRIRAKLNK